MTDTSKFLPPAGLAGYALVWWGVVTGRVVAGVVLAVACEAHRLVGSRWGIDDRQASDAWTLSLLLVAGSFVRGALSEGVGHALYFTIGWLPVTLAPMMLVALYGTRREIPLRVFLDVLVRRVRRRGAEASPAPAAPTAIHIEFGYLGIVALAAGAASPSAAGDGAAALYYPGGCVAVLWALLVATPRARAHPVLLVSVVAAVALVGYAGHIGLHALQLDIEQRIGIALGGDVESGRDWAATAIGSVGRLKLSNAIEWRMSVPEGAPPRYLRRTTYNVYHNGTWFNVRRGGLRPVERVAATDRWVLAQPAPAVLARNAQLRGLVSAETVDLPLPVTPLSITGLPAVGIDRSDLGVVRAHGLKGAVDFTVSFAADLPGDPAPNSDDVVVPAGDASRLAAVLARLGLSAADPATSVRDRLAGFFAKNFSYSTYLPAPEGRGALASFLEKTRTGHCEYFATATVLLLRQAGVPARYATGYAVDEYHPARHEFVLRGLHAHAWAQAWIDGRWSIVDTTPATWIDADRDSLSLLQPLQDWLQGVAYDWQRWQGSESGRRIVQLLAWVTLGALAAFLWFRVFRGGRRHQGARSVAMSASHPGLDSEWFSLEPALGERVGARSADTTPRVWWKRARSEFPGEVARLVDRILELHYRLRFDPRGLTAAERDDLRLGVRECKAFLAQSQARVGD